MSKEEMEQIKSSSDYSSVFRIVIDRKKLNDMDSFLPPVTFPGKTFALLSLIWQALRIERKRERKIKRESERERRFTISNTRVIV